MNINEILNRVNEYSRSLVDGHIEELDRDILLSDLRQLYLMAKAAHVRRPDVSEQMNEVPARTSKPITPNEAIEVPAPSVDEMIEKKIIEIENVKPIVHEVVAPPAGKEQTPLTNVIEFVKEETVKTKAISLNEIFAGEERSLNDRLSGEKRPMLNDQAARKDLKGMIDFNKQYILINELFMGDSQAFQTAISRINDSPTIELAFEYIKNELLPIYKWNAEMQSARLFDKLVRQKFGL